MTSSGYLPALELRDLSARYGAGLVLDHVNLTAHTGKITCLVGPNGAGKTTLLRAVLGILDFHRGEISGGHILLQGADITRWSPRARVSKGLAISPEGRRLFPDLSVDQNLRLGASGRRDTEVEKDLAAVYKQFPRLNRKDLQAGYLSGGEQQMAAIGRAMMARPRVLLLDEPSLGLAPLIVDQLFEIIEGLHASGLSILLVEQNVERALAIADYGYVLERGRIALHGPARDLAANPAVQASYLGIGA